MSPVMPGGRIGILGGGQLGRMMALAARSMGYRLEALDPDPACAARGVVDVVHTAPFSDVEAAVRMAKACEVVTLEIEKLPLATLTAVEQVAPLRPGAEVLRIIQHRGRQKTWLAANGAPLGPWREARSEPELATALEALGGRCFVKRSEGGYDGRGQVETSSASEAAQAWKDLGERPVVVEKALPLGSELSVAVARNPSGDVAVYPPAANHHVDRILSRSLLPGGFPDVVVKQATELARAIAGALKVEGLLVIELFLLEDGSLLVNELAPRPHNSFHATEVGCATSQFEQAIRAACDLPLGSVEVLRPSAIVNLLGDLWLGFVPPSFPDALAVPGVKVHLYGKDGARRGRKMGHLSATGATPGEALARVTEAARRLGVPES